MLIGSMSDCGPRVKTNVKRIKKMGNNFADLGDVMDLRDKCPKCAKGKLDVKIIRWVEQKYNWLFEIKCDNPGCGHSYQQ
jgi:hypothetical protein